MDTSTTFYDDFQSAKIAAMTAVEGAEIGWIQGLDNDGSQVSYQVVEDGRSTPLGEIVLEIESDLTVRVRVQSAPGLHTGLGNPGGPQRRAKVEGRFNDDMLAARLFVQGAVTALRNAPVA